MTALLMTAILPDISGKSGLRKPIENVVGIGLTSLTDEHRFNLAFCHMISERWSAGFETSLSLNNADEGKEIVSNCISVQHWPRSPLEGPMIGIGMRTAHKSDEDWFCDVAYGFRIFNTLMLSIGCRTSLLEKNRPGGLGTGALRLTLEYGF